MSVSSSHSQGETTIARALAESPLVRPVLERWDEIALPDSWLVAGAVAQTVWNKAHELPPAHGIKDIDIVYFDSDDLLEQSELSHARRVQRNFEDLAVRFDVKNQARVHMWYSQRFGYSIRPYTSSTAAIATFPTTAGAIGVRPSRMGLEFCAPFGVEDLLHLVVRPNKAQITAAIYAAKVSRWRSLWPQLRIFDWNVPTRQAGRSCSSL